MTADPEILAARRRGERLAEALPHVDAYTRGFQLGLAGRGVVDERDDDLVRGWLDGKAALWRQVEMATGER